VFLRKRFRYSNGLFIFGQPDAQTNIWRCFESISKNLSSVSTSVRDL
jgi:hypothetical protein